MSSASSARPAHRANFRQLQNNLVFLVADEQLREDMKHAMVRRLALQAPCGRPARLKELAAISSRRCRSSIRSSEQAVAVAIQQLLSAPLLPVAEQPVEGALVELGHTAFDIPSAADQPGKGQQQVERALADNDKLLRDTDHPLAPNYVRDQTPLERARSRRPCCATSSGRIRGCPF